MIEKQDAIKKVARLEKALKMLNVNEDNWCTCRGQLAEAQYALALILEEKGQYAFATELFYKAAMASHSGAFDRLYHSKLPLSDKKVEIEPNAEPAALFIKGLQAFSGIGQHSINNRVASQYVRLAAEAGYAPAQTNLGWMYRHGRGVAQDHTEAVKWYRKAALQGHALAQNNLGWMYGEGRGVAQDDTEAVKWYQKAALQGDAWAQYNLGWMYRQGLGVAQDHTEAVKWVQKAALQGRASAQNNLGWMYGKGLGVAQDHTEAVKWYQKAALQGLASGQHNLGVMYEEGRGVAQDDTEAVKWYQKAALQGLAHAQTNLGVIYKNNSPAFPIMASEAIEYRKDFLMGIKGAKLPLKKCAELGVFEARYHYVMTCSLDKQRSLLKESPHAFCDVLRSDELIGQDEQFRLLTELLNNHQRKERGYFETDETFNQRILNPDNLYYVTFAIAEYHSARLAKLPKKPTFFETQSRFDLSIKDLITLYSTIPAESEYYCESQLALSHLYYISNDCQFKGPAKTAFDEALKHDLDGSVIGLMNSESPAIKERAYNLTKSVIKIYLDAKAEQNVELMRSLKLESINQFAHNDKAIFPLIKLAIMDADNDYLLNGRLHFLQSLDPQFGLTRHYLSRLRKETVIKHPNAMSKNASAPLLDDLICQRLDTEIDHVMHSETTTPPCEHENGDNNNNEKLPMASLGHR